MPRSDSALYVCIVIVHEPLDPQSQLVSYLSGRVGVKHGGQPSMGLGEEAIVNGLERLLCLRPVSLQGLQFCGVESVFAFLLVAVLVGFGIFNCLHLGVES